MIFIDGNSSANVIFHSIIGEMDREGDIDSKNFKEDYPEVSKELLAMYTYGFFNSLVRLSKYKSKYGNIVIAFDSKKSWRQRFFPGYKSKRRKKKKTPDEKFKSDVLFKYMQLLKKLLEYTQFEVVETMYNSTYGIEGDEIISTLALNLPGPHLIVSVDNDYFQILNKDIKQINPKEYKILDTPSAKAVRLQQMEWYLKGQAKDSIPSIKFQTELSPDFIKWVKKEHDLDLDNSHIDKVEKNHQDLREEYRKIMFDSDEAEIEAGTRKRQRNLDIYKIGKFSAANLKEFIDNTDEMLKTNPRYAHNYKRNKKLISLFEVPQPVQEKILKTYEGLEKKFFNKVKLTKAFLKVGNQKHIELIDQF